MPKHSPPTSEQFKELLNWLGDDYLEIHGALVKIFIWNHCSDPQGLSDEVFDRIARKMPGLKESFVGDPKPYFYAVANNLFKEDRKAARLHVPLEGFDAPGDGPTAVEEETREMRSDCLTSCLATLSAEKRDLILDYYAGEKRDKIIHRAELAHRLGISIKALRVRMLRIRVTLEECMERCLDRKNQNP